jgi:hypothetical protein
MVWAIVLLALAASFILFMVYAALIVASRADDVAESWDLPRTSDDQ